MMGRALVIGGVMALSGACSVPPVFVTAPPEGDIRPPDDYNVFLRDAAEQAQLPQADQDRAARSIEMVMRAPIVLSTVPNFLANGGIVVRDSRFEGEQSIFNYVESGPLGSATSPISFGRAIVPRQPNEGECDLVAATDTSCDLLILHIADGAIPAGTEVVFVVSGDLEGYRVDANGNPIPEETFELGSSREIMLTVEEPTGPPLVLESYTLRLPGEGGGFEGLLEPGACTLCDPPPNNTILELPQVEFYIPPNGEIRGRFNEPPARFSVFAETGEGGFTALFPGAQLLGPNGEPFEIGEDREFVVPGPFPIGTKIHSFAIASDDLFTQLGTPNRFFLAPPTQTATGKGFVQSIGTDGEMPTSDIQHFTIAHVRINGAAEGGIDDGSVVVIEPGDPTPIALPVSIVHDSENMNRSVAELEVFIRDAADLLTSPHPVQSSVTMVSETESIVEFDLNQFDSSGDVLVLVAAQNAAGGSLGSDRIALTLDFERVADVGTEPLPDPVVVRTIPDANYEAERAAREAAARQRSLAFEAQLLEHMRGDNDLVVVVDPISFERVDYTIVADGLSETTNRCEVLAEVTAVVRGRLEDFAVAGEPLAYWSACSTAVPGPLTRAVLYLRARPNGPAGAPLLRVNGGFSVVQVGNEDAVTLPASTTDLADFIESEQSL